MNRPVVIVDPLSSGIELAPAFKARGIPAIGVTFKSLNRAGFGTKIQTADFVELIPNQPRLAEILKKYQPMAIIPGTELGVPLAEQLTHTLIPNLANDSRKSFHRLHKALMQEALQKAGVSALKTLNTSSEHEATIWIKENELMNAPLIIKPPVSAGSDKVFHISAKGDWKMAFRRVLNEPSLITGKVSDTAIVQEQALGTEFAVGTVSANGKHYLAHLIRYNKSSSADRKTIFDYVEFIPYQQEAHEELWKYTQQALDALGIRWGAAHNEIMLTAKGPRLIETGARMCGGPIVHFARKASGSSQADKLVEAYVDGDVSTKKYTFKQSVASVFLRSPTHGILSNSEAFAQISCLPNLIDQYIWFKDGDQVPQTVDYLTSIGIVGLAGSREDILLDYAKIRAMEKKIVVQAI